MNDGRHGIGGGGQGFVTNESNVIKFVRIFYNWSEHCF
jgi:hypothetical protein